MGWSQSSDPAHRRTPAPQPHHETPGPRLDPARPPAKFRPLADIRPTAVCLLALALSTLGLGAQLPDSLANGAYQPGTLASAGKIDTWTFSATAGSGIVLRMGGVNLTPRIRLFAPDHSAVAENVPGNTLNRDGVLVARAPTTGTYFVEASAAYAAQVGTYNLSLAVSTADFAVPAGDQGGAILNGAATAGTIALGDVDLWRFTAGAGDGLMLRMGAGSLTPWIRLYDPTGALVAETTSGNTLARDGFLSVVATNAGPYTAIVSSTYTGQIGDYQLHLARSPASFVVSPDDQGGDLENGSKTNANLTLGDLDLWSFAARTNDSVILRVGAASFTPWLRLYAPDGSIAAETTSGNTLARDGTIAIRASQSGTYTLVTGAAYSGQAGDYSLNLARAPGEFIVSPGDEGGPLDNGAANVGSLDLGDLDVWSFAAEARDNLLVRVGGTGSPPWLRLFDPAGALVAETTSGNTLARDGFLTPQATNAGSYTLVVAATYSGQQGPYSLTFGRSPAPVVVSPGDEGGPLVNGLTNAAALPLGDLDVWSFIGTPGDSNVLRVAATGFTPWLRLYGPDGALVRETISGNTLARNGSVSLNITNAGTYLLFVSATYGGQSGTYTLKESRVPPDLVLPPDPILVEGESLDVLVSAQDPDDPGKLLEFKLLEGPPGLTLVPQSATNARIAWATSEATGPSTNRVVATVTDFFGSRGYTRTNQFVVVVRELNLAPQLAVPEATTIDEGVPTVLPTSATDADLPANPLAFQLIDPPAGMQIDPATGAISWTPAEDQGPITTTVTVVVTDDSPSALNATHLATTNSFRLSVREINRAPSLTVPATRTIDESSPLSFSAVALDPDQPANPLGFRLEDAPAGMTVDPTTGAISWTPTESQGPATYRVSVVVTDDNAAAANTRNLSATNSFEVVVRETNRPPTLTVPGLQTIDELSPLSVTAVAIDDDLPSNALTFRLLSPAEGLAIDPATGVITWVPTEAQGPSTNTVTVVVTDSNLAAPDATAHLSVTNSFQVVVREVNLAPVLAPIADQTVPELGAFAVSLAVTDPDLPAQPLHYSLASAPAGATVDDAGRIVWNPTEADGPSTNLFVAVVTDGGDPVRSATNRFTMVVTEVNTAPRFASVADQTIHYGLPVTVPIATTDADLPAQTLVIRLLEGPQGMAYQTNSASLSWTPTQSQVGLHPVRLEVADSATPALTDTISFVVTVEGAGARLQIDEFAGGLKQIKSTGDVGLNYELQASADLDVWTRLVEFQMTAAPHVYIDPESATRSVRFYRLRLRQ